MFTENGQRKYRQGATEEKLADKLEKVRERLQADAANMERPGADLIRHYLDPDWLPTGDRWSRKHAHTQRRLCERFAAPVIAVPPRRLLRPRKLDAGAFGTDVASFRLHLAAENKAERTIKAYTEAVALVCRRSPALPDQ